MGTFKAFRAEGRFKCALCGHLWSARLMVRIATPVRPGGGGRERARRYCPDCAEIAARRVREAFGTQRLLPVGKP